MSIVNSLVREIKFTVRDRTIWFWMAIVFGLSAISLGFGIAEVERQNASIQRLIKIDQQDRVAQLEKQKSWGSAAYYSFHLSYDAPSDFAFAAMGLRDSQPWKHRVRMLALEGQIYERDVANPSFALIGRFDFAFFTAFIIPLILIILLYDLRSGERIAGRYKLLEATVGQARNFWLLRAGLRGAALFVCIIVPLVVAGFIVGTQASTLLFACLYVFVYVAFWTLLCSAFSAWNKTGSVILMSLVTVWVCTAVILPAGARLTIDKAVELPSGSDILMLQREAVNDAWDLPREATMNAFFEQYPEWRDYKPVESSFEWQWYYAFQQVGDQQADPVSNAYRNGRLRRDQLATWAALLAPPSLLERSLQSLAHTDLQASIHYEDRVRAYHAELKGFYYPKLFQNQVFDQSQLRDLPQYKVTQ
ncbi:DUF3526 domain-containing protein [Pseudoteredinibacter isoporae]|uniref:DUF3526 domain-containing protein n=1 Tax=Pseudoteredinibacter isoporae TaxID=570281 RepID=UPI00310BCA2F